MAICFSLSFFSLESKLGCIGSETQSFCIILNYAQDVSFKPNGQANFKMKYCAMIYLIESP